jgi:glycosyltransferase involved in cell wall biosynthesis
MPCLNEAATVQQVVLRIPRTIPKVSQVDVLVVDDGSTDDTARLATEAGAYVHSHGTNRGVGAALKSAISFALGHGYDLMVNIDGDGQFAPEDIPLLLAPILEERADFTTASRFKEAHRIPKKMSKVKLYGNKGMSFLISKLCGQKFHDVSCGFRAYSRETLLQLNLHGAFTYTQETFIDLVSKQLRIVEVPLDVQYFEGRKSRVAGNIIRYAINSASIITRIYRDYFPFKFFMTIAAASLALAVGFGSIVLYYYITTGRFIGHVFIASISAFFILLTLLFFFAAVVTDMLVRIRNNQERMLYLAKKSHYSCPEKSGAGD